MNEDSPTPAEAAAVADANSEVIAAGITKGVARSRISLADKRLLIIYMLMTVFVVLSLAWENHQTSQLKAAQAKLVAAQHAAVVVCQQQNAGNTKFNALLDQLAKNATNSTGITAAQKAEALADYAQAHLPVVDCSHLGTS